MATLTLGKSVTIDAVQSKKGDAVFVERRRRIVAPGNKELREELTSLGHIFKTRSDSEVLLHGYEHFGDCLLDRLRGMFAFVIYDRRDNSLFGARDMFGIKPFYYTEMNGSFIYGSAL